MKYTVDIIIEKPIDEVVRLFDDPEITKQWMEDLHSFMLLSGKPGQPGARSKLIFKKDDEEIEMIETIQRRNLPEEYSGTFEADDFYNHVINRFVSLDGNKTKYITKQEFRFKSLLMRLIGFFRLGMLKKHSIKYMKRFKEFVEQYDKQTEG